MNTQKGTKNGDTWTFRVNASAHNYEGGKYVTHIYAIDKGGNQTQLVLDEVDVKDQVPEPEPEPEQIQLSPSADYARDGALITNVKLNTTVADLLTRFETQGLVVRDKNGKTLSNTAKVSTGTTLELYSSGVLVDTVTVVIRGDVDGSGCIDTTDYMRIKAAMMGNISLGLAERAAADVDQSGSVNSTDHMRIKAFFLGNYDL